MAINFTKIAQRNTLLSDIYEGRKKVEKMEGEVNLKEFDIVSDTKGQPYAVCAISDTEFINGGHVLTKIFLDIVNEYNGDIATARADFKASGGLHVELAREKTKGGRDIVTVKVIA